MKETRCIVCGKEKDGLEVRDDKVIEAIRWFKRNVTKNEKGYRLVVCKECYPVYLKARKRFERRQALYIAVGVVFAALILFASVNKALALLYGIAIVVFVYLLSILTYVPALNMPAQKKAQEKGTKKARQMTS